MDVLAPGAGGLLMMIFDFNGLILLMCQVGVA